jgi:hypothetical protein
LTASARNFTGIRRPITPHYFYTFWKNVLLIEGKMNRTTGTTYIRAVSCSRSQDVRSGCTLFWACDNGLSIRAANSRRELQEFISPF